MRDPIYGIFVIFHVLSAVIGFGALITSGSYSYSLKKTKDPLSSESLSKYFNGATNYAGHTIFLVPVFGVILLYLHHWHELTHPYPWVGIGCWVVGVSVAIGVIFPREKSLGRLMHGFSDKAVKRERGLQITGTDSGEEFSAADAVLSGSASDISDEFVLMNIKKMARDIERASAITSVCFVIALVFMVIQPSL